MTSTKRTIAIILAAALALSLLLTACGNGGDRTPTGDKYYARSGRYVAPHQ